MAGEPNEIVPIPALDPALPFATENGVHLPGEEIGQAERPDGERDRPEEITGLRRESRGRIDVDLQLDLQHLVPGDLLDEAPLELDRDHLGPRVGLEERGLDGRPGLS